MKNTTHSRACFASHLGVWLAEPNAVRQAHAAIVAGIWSRPDAAALRRVALRQSAALRADDAISIPDPTDMEDDGPEVEPLYFRSASGVALISLVGGMAKSAGKYATAGTVQVRRALRTAAADSQCRAVLLVIDSPGGMVAGTLELANEVKATAAQKPVYCHVEDQMASAAYWVGCQASRVTANQAALVGSLGVYAVIEDSSGAAEAEGTKVIVVSTGPLKGAGAEGAPVSKELIDSTQTMVNDLNALFLQGVCEGRKMSADQAASVFTGEVWIAAKAQALGLIDAVESYEQTVAWIEQSLANETAGRRLQLAKRRAMP